MFRTVDMTLPELLDLVAGSKDDNDFNARLLEAVLGRPEAKGPAQPRGSSILNEAAIERLRAFAEKAAAPNPYSPRDLVTPRRDACVLGAGRPHVVIETLKTPYRTWTEPHGSNNFGRALDTRVACLDGDRISSFWCEHAELEAFAEPAAARAAA